MRKPDTASKFTLLMAAALLFASSSWAVKSWQQLMASAITGVAFYDCNGNGTRDNNEAPFDGVNVMLVGTTAAGSQAVSITTTDNAGNYSFSGVEAGTYTVKFLFPTGASALSFTAKSTAINGSDVNAAGQTDPLSIDGTTNVAGIDAGIIDRTAPVVTFVNPAITPYGNGDTITVQCDNLPSMNPSWASATDNSGKAVQVQFIDLAISTNDCARTGYITILSCIFRATDACGNVGERSIFVKIKDTKAPVLSGIPTDVTVNTARGESIPAAASGVLATDNCSANPVAVAFAQTEILNTCGKIIMRTWSAIDDCGNTVRRSQNISVISNATCSGGTLIGDTIRLTLKQNVTLDTCLTLPTGGVLSNIQHCGAGQPSATVTLTASNCLRVTPSVNYVGIDTFCAKMCDVNGLTCRDMKFIIDIQAARLGACDIVNGMRDVNLTPRVCGENACYCIVGTSLNTLRDEYKVTDNGRPYDGGFGGCQFDTIFSYNYFTIPVMGSLGPYRLDYWQVNGTTRQIANFQTAQQLTDSMNRWDPMGNWRIDPTRFLIYGGDSRSQYGQMKITGLSNGAFGLLELNTGLIANGVKLCFSRGLHTIIFQNIASGCTDTLRANVFCSDVRSAPIAVDDRVSTPKNTPIRIAATVNDTLNGVFESLVGLTQPLRGSVSFQNAQTFLYTPNADFCGRDSFDYRVCNAFGLCDTGRIFVETTCGNDTTGGGGRKPVAVNDAVTTRLNTAVTFSPLANDTLNGTLTRPLSIVRFQTRGSVNVINNQITYTPASGFCNDRDSFDYEICNANGCATARVVVNVTCEGDTTGGGGRKPVALNDGATTRLNTAVTITPLANDTLNGALTGPLSITRFQMHGTINVINNQVIYTPMTGFCNDRDSFDYQICNANGCATARVVVTVTCEGDTTGGNGRKPVAVNDVATTRSNTPVTIAILQNDNLNGALVRPLSITRFQTRGTVSIVGNQIIYTPISTFCGGQDTLTYEICNANGCATANVYISVICDTTTGGGGSGRKVVAVNDNITTPKNTSITFRPTLNDTIKTKLLSLMIGSAPRHGTIAFKGIDTLLYTPTLNFCGRDTLAYTICDTSFICSDAFIFINVTCNDTTGGGGETRKPTALNDFATTQKGRAVTIAVLTNDSTFGALTRPVSVFRAPRNGTATVQNNQIIYTPNATFCGSQDTITYEICNANGCATANVYINVICDTTTGGGGSGRKIVAVNDNITTPKNTSITFRPTLNDTIKTKLLSLMIGSAPRHGSIAFKGIDTLLYTPTLNFCGRDTLAYTICDTSFICSDAFIFINVTCNDTTGGGGETRKPTALNDFATTQKGRPVTIAVLTNDSTFGALTRPVSVIRAPRNGTATVQNNQIIYAPNATFCGGRDTIVYEICNANGCATAAVYIAVSCDTTTGGGGGSGRKIVAVNDNITTRKNVSLTFRPTLNDTVQTKLLSLMIINSPRNGTIGFTGLDTLLYRPNLGFCGRDTLEYTICDTSFNCASAFIFINVTCDSVGNNLPLPIAVNDTARTGVNQAVVIDVLGNDTLNGVLRGPLSITTTPRFGTATVSGNQVVYTPNAGFCGSRDTLTYQICNANGCATARVSINVICDSATLTRPPVAVPDYATTRKRTPIRINILRNDTLNGTLDSIKIVVQPSRGLATIGTDNVLTYASDTCGFSDTLIYKICNRNGCDTALVVIKVTCDTVVNNALLPIAVNDTARLNVNQSVVIDVLLNDTLNGVLSRPLSIKVPPRFGTARVNGTNQIVYTPFAGFCGGRDTVIYEICNANGCSTAVVSINVICDAISATLPPVAVFDTATTRKNTPIRIAILANDTLNGTLDSIKIIRSPLLGIASLGSDNVLTYTPDSCGFTDSLIYRICNRNGCDTAIVRIKVPCDAVNTAILPPVAVFDTARVAKGQTVTIVVTANDTLRNADTFRITRRPIHGTAAFDLSRNIVFKSDSTYCGNDTLIYEICNNRGCDTALVTIKITCDTLPPTLRPVAVDDNVRTIINRRVDFVILGNDTLRGARFAEMVSPPQHGTIIIMPDSMAMYKPDKEFCGLDSVMYRICNAAGCDTAVIRITVECGDTLEVFRGFSPNNDGKNDRFVIRGIENFPDNEVIIMNRWGNQVFSQKGYRNESGWQGDWNDKQVPDGTYFYCIRLNDAKNQQFTGYIQLMR